MPVYTKNYLLYVLYTHTYILSMYTFAQNSVPLTLVTIVPKPTWPSRQIRHVTML